MNTNDRLEREWDGLCKRTRLVGAGTMGRRLLDRYAEPHRAFHTPEHLASVLDVLADADDRLLLAAWFHDAVYAPGSADNEAQSAVLARAWLGQAGVAVDTLDFICDAILATCSHGASRPEFAALLDADLSILGSAADAYAAYRQAIRCEFRAVPEWMFRRGRAAFLRDLLNRPSIFQTQSGNARFERQARRNLHAELDEFNERGRSCA